MISHASDVGRLKEVVFSYRQLGVRFVPYATCAYCRTNNILTHVNVLYRHDPSAAETLKGNIDNHLVSSQVSKKRNKRIQWTFEAALMEITFNRFSDISVVIPNADADRYFRSIDECNSTVVTIPYPELRPVDPFHFLSLFIVTSIMLVLPFNIRACENKKYSYATSGGSAIRFKTGDVIIAADPLVHVPFKERMQKRCFNCCKIK